MSILALILLVIAGATLPPAAPAPARSSPLVPLATPQATRVPAAVVSDAAVPAAAPSSVSPPSPSPTPPPAPATRPGDVPPGQAVTLGLILVGVAAIGMALARVFRRGSIGGPARLGAQSRVVPLLLITLLGGGVWLTTQVAYFTFRAYQYARDTGGERLTLEQLAPQDFAALATLPGSIALLVLLAGDAAGGLLRPIGFHLARLPRGLLVGLGFGILALVLMQGSSLLLAAVYEVVGYEHPQEHELLAAMKSASPTVKMMLVLGACVMAPLFEEALFRGHMQTLLVRLFTFSPGPRFAAAPTAIMADPRIPPPGDVLPMPPLGVPQQGYAPAVPPPMPMPPVFPLEQPAARETAQHPWPPPPVLYASPAAAAGASTAMRWLAVVITSAVFASVHPLWTAPLIFVLSLCLGYAYERTGNLWVPIVMHALFNTSSTVAFLNLA